MGAFDDLLPPQQRDRERGAFDDLIAPTTRSSASELGHLPQLGPRVGRAEAFGSSALDMLSFGTSDEIGGAMEGASAALSGGSYQDAYRRRVAEARERLAAGRSQHPVSSGLGMLAGGIAMTVGTGGVGTAARAGQLGARAASVASAPLFRAAAGRGVGALASQSAISSGAGVAGGAVYGLGSGDGDWQTRLESAGQGALWGGTLGAVSPALFQGVGARSAFLRAPAGAAVGSLGSMLLGGDPLQGAIAGAGGGVVGRPIYRNFLRPAWTRLNEVQLAPRANAGAGVFGTQIFSGGGGGPRAPRPPQVPETVVRRMDTALGRARVGAGALDESVRAAQADTAADIAAGQRPLDRRLADLGDEFSAEVDALANMPGETFTRATDIKRARATALPEVLQTELRSYLGITRSPVEAMDGIRASAREVGAGYERVVGQVPQPAGVQRLQRLMDTPEMQPALRMRYETEEAIERLAQHRGQPPPPRSVVLRETPGEPPRFALADDVNGQQLHLLKAEIDEVLSAATDRSSMSYAARSKQRVLDDYRDEYLTAMEEALPGYEMVRKSRGDLFDAERALDVDDNGHSRMGQRLLRLRPEEIARRMQETVTPTGRRRPTTRFEREMYRIAVADEVLRRVEDYASAASDKTRNAGEVFDRIGLQNRLRAVFGAEDGAIDTFLARATERAEMLRRAASWTGNSASARRLTRAGDQFLAAVASLGRAAQGDAGGAAQGAGTMAYNALIGRHLERQNNAFGEALLRDLDSPESKLYIDALMRELRRLEEERLRRATGAAGEGVASAIGGGSVIDDGY